MKLDTTKYVLPGCFSMFRWHPFTGQRTRNVTYFYAVTPAVRRLRGESSVLYVGQTENEIAARYKQETETNNTPGNTQATNIRTSYVMRQLRAHGDHIDMFFTESISFVLPKEHVVSYGRLLETWNKNNFVKQFKPRPDGTLSCEIEKFLIANYADEHLEVPPLNNRAG